MLKAMLIGLAALAACSSIQPDVKIAYRAEDVARCTPLGHVSANGMDATGALSNAQDDVRSMGGNGFLVHGFARNAQLPGDMAIFTIGSAVTVMGEAVNCPIPGAAPKPTPSDISDAVRDARKL